MNPLKSLLLILVVSLSPALSRPALAADDCAQIDKAGVAALFDQWNLALATLDPDAVAQRYWNDAVLLPTVSNTPRNSPAMVRDYFVHFLEKHPRGRIDSRTIQLGCNLAIDMGTYTFSLMNDSGTPAEVAARYTYVYAWRNGDWRILHHHSSAMPELPSAQTASPASHGAGADHGPAAASKAGRKEARDGKGGKPGVERDTTAQDSTKMFLNAESSPPIMDFYPLDARARREAGRVAMRVCADPDGRLVGEPKVLKSSGHDRLDSAARDWARAAKWVPATSNRRSVEGCTEVTAQFRP